MLALLLADATASAPPWATVTGISGMFALLVYGAQRVYRDQRADSKAQLAEAKEAIVAERARADAVQGKYEAMLDRVLPVLERNQASIIESHDLITEFRAHMRLRAEQ